jgi:hypothetical protein
VSGSASSGDNNSSGGSSSRDQDLKSRGLEPDSSQLGQQSDEANPNLQGDKNDNDDVWIMEEWQLVNPAQDQNIGAPAENESGTSSSDQQNQDRYDQFNSSSKSSSSDDTSLNSGSSGGSMTGSSSSSGSSYGDDLYRRVQKDWSDRLGTDVPNSPGLMGRTIEELENARYYNDTAESSGAQGASVSGSKSSSKADSAECQTHKGSSASSESGSVDRGQSDLDGSVTSSFSGAPGASVSGSSSSSSDEHDRYHINRGEDQKYHINREASGDRSSSETSAPGEYGDRATSENYDDGHLNGNNAVGNSGSYDSSSSAKDISRPDSGKSSPGRAQGGDENSATNPE